MMENEAGYFPLFVDLRGKKVLIVGAGAIAARRATVLVEFGAKVTVVAPEEGNRRMPNHLARTSDFMNAREFVPMQAIEPAGVNGRTGQSLGNDSADEKELFSWECRTVSIRALAKADRLVWKQRTFEEQDLDQAFLVLTATNDPAVNDNVVRLCHKRGIPVNHAGDQSQCDFQFPAVVRKPPVVIGVNAAGKDHGLVKRVAAKLRRWIAGERF